MDDLALTHAERALFDALNRRQVRFLLIGMGAAVLEGAPVATQDLHVWFATIEDDRIALAAKDAGGFWISGFGMQPPAFRGDGLSRIDVVLTAHGLQSFDVEYARGLDRVVDGIPLKVLPLERVIASKRSLKRAKDRAQLPALEATLLVRRQQSGDP